MRIYEFAKQKNISSKEIVCLLEKEGFAVTSHMSVLTEEAEHFLNKHFTALPTSSIQKVKNTESVEHVKDTKIKKEIEAKTVQKDKKISPVFEDKKIQNTEKNIFKHSLAKDEKKHHSSRNADPVEAPLSFVSPSVKFDGIKPEQNLLKSDNPEVLKLLEGVAEFEDSRSKNRSSASKGPKIRGVTEVRSRGRSRKNYQRRQERLAHSASIVPEIVTEIHIRQAMSLEQAAEMMGKNHAELILSLLKKGMVCTKNYLLPIAVISDLAQQYGIKVEVDRQSASSLSENNHVSQVVSQKGTQRWPIVVVIGHVDHGKTTFLDYIRKANVAGKEKGGITQHLGAYEVESPNGKIVFLDTPGHEAFSFLRSRGIKVTDIAILMVAADDGVMPQTIEAIKSAKKAGVTLIVAINKVDKLSSTAPIESVKRELAQHDILVEDWGGSVICAPISAKTGQGIPELLEMISLQAQMMDLQANQTATPKAFVLESKLDKGYGPVATVIPIEGTLRNGDYFYAGEATGKVRLLLNSKGERIQEAGPSLPVQIVGFDKFAPLGEWLTVVNASEYAKIKAGKSDLLDVSSNSALTQFNEVTDKSIQLVRAIVKVDTHGTAEAIQRILDGLAKKNKEVAQRLQIISITIGDISEKDILLAEDLDALVIGLHVKVERNAQSVAKDHKVETLIFDVIYHLTEKLEELIQKSRKMLVITTKTGEAVVRKVFPLKNNTAIAGCYITDGVFARNSKVICMRNNKKVGESKINSLQRDKKVVKEVHSGYECGFLTDSFHEWQEGDIVQCFVETKEMPK